MSFAEMARPYHLGSSKPVLHRIYHDALRPSPLLLPIIPTSSPEPAA